MTEDRCVVSEQSSLSDQNTDISDKNQISQAIRFCMLLQHMQGLGLLI
jgi:hypothetical protein